MGHLDLPGHSCRMVSQGGSRNIEKQSPKSCSRSVYLEQPKERRSLFRDGANFRWSDPKRLGPRRAQCMVRGRYQVDFLIWVKAGSNQMGESGVKSQRFYICG